MWVPQALRSRAGSYAVAVLAVLVVLSLRLGLEGLLEGQVALLSFVLAIIAAAAWGGLGPGLLATGLGAVLGVVWFIGPERLVQNPVEIFRMLIYLLEGIILSLVFERLHRRTQALSQTLRELEQSQARLAQARLAQAALCDALTGLGNRRAFEQDLLTEMERARREGVALTLLIADLDKLKQVNDQQGHAEGDRLIVSFARLLRETLRQEDRVYRIGGDEFAALLPRVDRDEFFALSKRLSILGQKLQQDSFPQGGASFGLAVFPYEAQEAEALQRLADERMYAEKEQRRRTGLSGIAG